MLAWIYTHLAAAFSGNQFLSGGLVLGIVGGLIAYLRNLPGLLWARFLAHCTTVVDIESRDPLYGWIRAWLAVQPYTGRAGMLSASSGTGQDEHQASASNSPMSTRVQRPAILFHPAPGVHWLRYEGRFIRVSREKKEHTGKDGWTSFSESISLRFYTRDREFPRRLMAAARDLALPPGDDSITVCSAEWNTWSFLAKVPSRSLESVILPDGLADGMVETIGGFLGSKVRYDELGIPYHLGLLLEGPPGSGKTSAIRALAGRFGLRLYLMSFRESYTASRLRGLLASIPPRSLLVVEDVDRDPTVVDTASPGASKETLLDLSGVLNALDGITTPSGLIVVMTANHPERLDAALVRPGRIDRTFHFSAATGEMARQLFLRFFSGDNFLAELFGAGVEGLTPRPSMAALQGHLLAHSTDAGTAASAPIADRQEADREPLHVAC